MEEKVSEEQKKKPNYLCKLSFFRSIFGCSAGQYLGLFDFEYSKILGITENISWKFNHD